MTNCTQLSLEFPPLKRHKVEAEFSGGDITSDGGVLLLRDIDRRLGLLKSVSRVLHDPRDPGKVVHSQLSLLQQRVYGLCLGYEDLNDHHSRYCQLDHQKPNFRWKSCLYLSSDARNLLPFRKGSGTKLAIVYSPR